MADGCACFHTADITPADIPDIAAIESACFRDPWSPAAMAKELSIPGGGGLAAWRAGTNGVAGYIFFRFILDEMHILKVAMDRKWRRQHGAFLLVSKALDRARRMNMDRAFLEVRASNEAAVKLYEKLGFAEAGRRPGYYYDDNDDAIMMIHLLKEA
ncbi:MAG: ribosomal protein S18-alanine N-acetyltransferase [Thermodesulfobacteriota bacterium]